MTVVTRFAPSPTGFLHIGGARTALFNWLFARHHGGRFLLRIEDTDRRRSTDEAVAAILDGLSWLGLDWDDEPVSQFSRRSRHVEAARRLLDEGKAYRCYATQEELAEMRERAKAEGRRMLYDGRWRDRDPGDARPGVEPVIRFKAPRDGETVIEDAVQGTVRVANGQLDDMVLLRSDETPTYMLAVVVDDRDMGITHAIRGDDHLSNAFRQTQLFRAFGWEAPVYAHIPLIHGADGARLSKRHGALGVGAYRDMGILPDALVNGLLRLGWSHGDHEIIARDRAIEWFGLDRVGRGAARFDLDKLMSLNAHYIHRTEPDALVEMIRPDLERAIGTDLDPDKIDRLIRAMPELKPRANNLVALAESAAFYVAERPIAIDAKAAKLLGEDARSALAGLLDALGALESWEQGEIERAIRGFAHSRDTKLGAVAQPLRACLAGTTVSPGIFEVAAVLGREETLGRIEDAIGAGDREARDP